MSVETIGPGKQTYFTQLDALRAIAVSMVIYSHWAGYHPGLWTDDVYWFNGEVGVQLFFVLSGFLITGILLDERAKAGASGLGHSSVLGPFYMRRFLRIFPVFYATLLVTFILGHPDVRQSVEWHVVYLSNFFFAARGEYLGDVSHFWSLAVEEQFYFIWPFIILFVSGRYLPAVMLFCICLAPVFRYVTGFIFHFNEVAVNVLPVSSLDTLAGGSLLAVLYRGQRFNIDGEKTLANLALVSIVCGCGYIAVRSFIPVPPGYEPIALFIARIMLVIALLGIVLQCSRGRTGPLKKLLEFEPLSFIGKISYGIYIFHFFIPWLTWKVFTRIGYPVWQEQGMIVYLIINLLVLLLISSLSWYLFEKPLNDLKRYFPYVSASPSVKGGIYAWIMKPCMRLMEKMRIL